MSTNVQSNNTATKMSKQNKLLFSKPNLLDVNKNQINFQNDTSSKSP